ncbi:hypothetical protein [Tabrizicola sp.]|uniref:hypothetical protein n=1 Tax=Tabrizicola sp. TaxID=2005166 RepID=UPI00273717F4|nr:hypothetical protein [Tabrizicola sp.]MDP3650038.1 hypothetical protein [Paracoccaceae bacterium]
MIAETWARSATNVDWVRVPLPHKVSLVAIALAERLERTEYGEEHFFAYGISLGVVLNTAFRNAANLGFSPLDELLITSAARVSESVNERLASLPVSQELQAFVTQDDASER